MLGSAHPIGRIIACGFCALRRLSLHRIAGQILEPGVMKRT
jgi:hypothetical protein